MEYLFLKEKNASNNLNKNGYILRSLGMIRIDEEFNILSYKVFNFNPNIDEWDTDIELKDEFTKYPSFKELYEELKKELLSLNTIILNDNPFFLTKSIKDTCKYNELDNIVIDIKDTLELRLAYPSESLRYKEEIINEFKDMELVSYDSSLLIYLNEEVLRMKLLVISKNQDLSKIIKSYNEIKIAKSEELERIKEIAIKSSNEDSLENS